MLPLAKRRVPHVTITRRHAPHIAVLLRSLIATGRVIGKCYGGARRAKEFRKSEQRSRHGQWGEGDGTTDDDPLTQLALGQEAPRLAFPCTPDQFHPGSSGRTVTCAHHRTQSARHLSKRHTTHGDHGPSFRTSHCDPPVRFAVSEWTKSVLTTFAARQTRCAYNSAGNPSHSRGPLQHFPLRKQGQSVLLHTRLASFLDPRLAGAFRSFDRAAPVICEWASLHIGPKRCFDSAFRKRASSPGCNMLSGKHTSP